MAFSDWLIVGAVGLLAKKGIENAAEERARQEAENRKYEEERKKREAESARRDDVNTKRKNTICHFKDGLTYEDFSSIAHKVAKRIRRIKTINVQGPVIYCTVESQTGYSDWDFKVDFNDWGHITGTYWKWVENYDSNIPEHFGQMVSGEVHQFLRDKSIYLPEFSDYVNDDKVLGTTNGLTSQYKSNFFRKIISKENQVISRYDSQNLTGEHIYVVVAMLRKNGYKNIKSIPVKDIGVNSTKDLYEVELVVINGTSFFEKGDVFSENAQVLITYHLKQEISIPHAMNQYKRKNYIEVGDQLQALGFSNIYERKIKDLKTGWVIKDGSVEEILVNTTDGEKPYSKNELYEYDIEIVITYHTYK